VQIADRIKEIVLPGVSFSSGC